MLSLLIVSRQLCVQRNPTADQLKVISVLLCLLNYIYRDIDIDPIQAIHSQIITNQSRSTLFGFLDKNNYKKPFNIKVQTIFTK